MSHQRIALLGEFACLGADCEDTCCKGWDMQLDQPHRDLYKSQAPELLDAVDEHDGQLIMRRDAETDFCVKYSSGLCLIHKEKDEDFSRGCVPLFSALDTPIWRACGDECGIFLPRGCSFSCQS